ncbi:MAG: helix-turn-helix domain-containing protein [candidate division WOR-3 bacterium]|nr:helix-turn-helix domain-containing protein [candidate division WOR-3 bacterium]MDW8150933.1 helix-turn-helix domain-containing protein [candidate division WOR-3 bacterium]
MADWIRKYLILKEYESGISIKEISEKYGLSKNSIYKIIKEKWYPKITELDQLIYNFVQEKLILDHRIISKHFNISEKLAKNILAKLGFLSTRFSNKEEKFIIELIEKGLVNDAVEIVNRIKKEPSLILMKYLKEHMEHLEDRLKITLIWYKFASFEEVERLLNYIEELLLSLKERKQGFWMIELLSIKCILLWNMEKFREIIKIYNFVKDKIDILPTYVSSRFLSTYSMAQIAYNNKTEFQTALKKLQKLSKKCRESLIRYTIVLINYGNIRRAMNLVEKAELDIPIKINLLFENGHYEKVIEELNLK